MATKVGEFFVEMAVDAASGNLSVRELIGALGELNVASVTEVAVLTRITEKLFGMADAAVQTAVEFRALSDITGIGPKMAQQWERAAERVVHHAGSMLSAIRAVNDMNKGLAVGQAPPAEISGILGTTPYKAGPHGEMVLKTAIDYLREFSAPGSTYRSRDRLTQERGLSALFGGSSEDMYRVLRAMIAGKFHPELISGMDNKQVSALNRVDSDRIKLGQQLNDIFQKLLTSGDDAARALEYLSKWLERLDEFLGKNRTHSYIDDLKHMKQTMSQPGAWGDLFSFTQGFSMRAMLLEMVEREARLGHPELAAATNDKNGTGELRGRLDINLTSGGKKVGSKTAYIDQAGTMRDFWNVADQLGNTP